MMYYFHNISLLCVFSSEYLSVRIRKVSGQTGAQYTYLLSVYVVTLKVFRG